MRFSICTKIFFICIITCSIASAVETRIAYSDLISDDLQEIIYKDFSSLYNLSEGDDPELSVIRSGSFPLIEDFLSDRLDICILALPEGRKFSALEEDNIIKIPFGYKSSVVVVNVENPIMEITVDQLARLFGDSGATAKLLSWRDFGMASFSTSSIKTYAIKEPNGISSDLFRHKVLKENSLSSSITFDEQDKVLGMIEQDKAAIGVFPCSPENPNLKVLFVAQDEESIAYGPSIDNIYYSDYPIRLPFYIVFDINDTEQLYPLIKILLSDQVSDIIQDNNFYPLPKLIREKFIIDLQSYFQEN